MFDRFLPQRIDNSYCGHKLALWLFALVVFMKTSIGLGTIFNGRNAAISADGMPLDTFTPAGAQAFASLFAAWGLAQTMIGLLCIVVLVRYRALVPFMYSLLLLEHLGRKLIFVVMPIADLCENVSLTTAAEHYAWVSTRQSWGVGTVKFAVGKIRIDAYMQ